jgi:hypothetical protein
MPAMTRHIARLAIMIVAIGNAIYWVARGMIPWWTALGMVVIANMITSLVLAKEKDG